MLSVLEPFTIKQLVNSANDRFNFGPVQKGYIILMYDKCI